MIGFLNGTLVARHPPQLLVDVGGVGYELEAPMSTFYQLPETGQPVRILTHLLVREDAHVLYGFASEAERQLFRSLIKVSGVGARIALAILSGISVEAFVRCVEGADAASLTRIPGVGRKTADRLIVEMRDRLEQAGSALVQSMPAGVEGSASDEAFGALVALGYRPQEAQRLLKLVADPAQSTEGLIRAALQAAAR
ncbi:Holliday junction branch migration protein RuvA [Wenzhouxiangella sp. XN24]|uniref:Holliday junction branch migration protein RuvA n=1 Tax=Wenzhouxiangella sp. XN24 TaxID=2713569 RepID=UPI0013ED5C69|nr:Holliday junction branch migration protein RuvA [Wenzhouxiangella sp. XN24]NGX16654.1 Holliday junction branch migration protein RuvA [Wenzhouxiangella sp. XN24]